MRSDCVRRCSADALNLETIYGCQNLIPLPLNLWSKDCEYHAKMLKDMVKADGMKARPMGLTVVDKVKSVV